MVISFRLLTTTHPRNQSESMSGVLQLRTGDRGTEAHTGMTHPLGSHYFVALNQLFDINSQSTSSRFMVNSQDVGSILCIKQNASTQMRKGVLIVS